MKKFPKPPPTIHQQRLEALIQYREDIINDMIKYSQYELLYTILQDRYETVNNWIIEMRKEE